MSGIIDAEFVTYRLEESGKTLLSQPGSVGPKKLGAHSYGYVADIAEGWTAAQGTRAKPPTPSAKAVTRMDEAYAWLSLLPNDTDGIELRKVVGARSLVSPITERHVVSWQEVAKRINSDYRTAQERHKDGIAMLVRLLRRLPAKTAVAPPQAREKVVHAYEHGMDEAIQMERMKNLWSAVFRAPSQIKD